MKKDEPKKPREIEQVDFQQALGHLQMCVDRRYIHALQQKFEAATGLQPGQYWLHTEAGGTPKMESSRTSPNYAYANGARKMGWCAHGSFCGGYGGKPAGVPDDVIRDELKAMFYKKVAEYPDATHWAFFITDNPSPGTIWEIGPIVVV